VYPRSGLMFRHPRHFACRRSVLSDGFRSCPIGSLPRPARPWPLPGSGPL
jgi:hypothetical protein